ncbi:isopentenyl-diphosphate Delta-isomerase [Actinomadura sp. NBRC 104412]|uniref:isopentenyl-diphosphate Delta-isomerase n=1 Tax=Actinomadura sp. NBRC 104412 TaxID=3032203 RepID=UPI0024A4FCEC|nr:isopentenyl-diphosphate Delta-isomerase [Actinomadura sp. NBRC 104412]GLZ04609.1 isopentenyl-diphosphate Delta-isomerase [Actinomadura sp. NBRC 104412]
MGVEEIVLLNEADEAIGSAPKVPSHHRTTPYHLAFSCFLLNTSGKVLITRRALGKRTFPGVWTGSCCGHPGPGEGLRAAVARRLRDELGVEAQEFTSILPGFRYQATAADGTVENERCPVVRAIAAADTVHPDPDEVEDAQWWTWERCKELAARPEASPWFRLQMGELVPLGDPLEWPDAGVEGLPPFLTW